MTNYRVILAAVLLVTGAAWPLAAQAPAPAPSRGKVPGASPGKTIRPSPTLMPVNPSPAARTAPPGTNQPSPTQQGQAATPRATVTSQAAVTPQAMVTPPATTVAAATATFTAGLGLQPFAGDDNAARLEYARTLARNLDSAAVSLVNLYRGTSGQPMAGATGPATLSGRERDRWTRCRDLYWDFTSFQAATQSVRDGLSPTYPLYRAAAALDTALGDVEALAECDNVASMISAPDRFPRWTEEYTSAAQHFYADWYAQIREAHEKDRVFAMALNALLPAGLAVAVPPGLSRTPPYAGASVGR